MVRKKQPIYYGFLIWMILGLIIFIMNRDFALFYFLGAASYQILSKYSMKMK